MGEVLQFRKAMKKVDASRLVDVDAMMWLSVLLVGFLLSVRLFVWVMI